MRHNRNKIKKSQFSKTATKEETSQTEDLIIMDDVDAVRSVLLFEREEKEYLRNEVKALKKEVKRLNNCLSYYQSKNA
jgi:polyhydroxyalkanoate synthesis regulator phasin